MFGITDGDKGFFTVIILAFLAVAGFKAIKKFILFGKMSARVNFFNGYVQNGQKLMIKLWRWRIQKKLDKEPGLLGDFLENIQEENISQFKIIWLIERQRKSTTSNWLGRNYGIAKKRNFSNIANLIKSAGVGWIEHQGLEVLRKSQLENYEVFFEDVGKPTVFRMLKQVYSLQELNALREKTSDFGSYHELLDKREIELLKEQLAKHMGIINFFELFEEVGTESVAGKFLLKEFNKFLTNLPHINSPQFLKDIEKWKEQFVPLRLYLEHALPKFSENDIAQWAKLFQNNSECMELLKRRMQEEYEKADYFILADGFKKYLGTAFAATLDDLLTKKINQLIAEGYFEETKENVITAWEDVPDEAEAFLILSKLLGRKVSQKILEVVVKED